MMLVATWPVSDITGEKSTRGGGAGDIVIVIGVNRDIGGTGGGFVSISTSDEMIQI